MDVRDKIKELLDKEETCISEAAKELGINRMTLTSWASTTYPRVNDLIRLAEYFGKPISYFFDDYQTTSNNQKIKGKNVMATLNGDLNIQQWKNDEEIKHLQSLLSEKEKMISEKERVIQILINQLDLLKGDNKRDNSLESENNED